MIINRFVKSLVPYKLSSHKAWEIKDKSSFLKLDWNESTQSPSPYVKQKLHELIDAGKLNYYPDVDNVALREQLAKYAGSQEDFIQYFSSSDGAYEYIFRAFSNYDNNILIVGPTYDNLRVVAETSGLSTKIFDLDMQDNFRPDEKNLWDAVAIECPNIVYICNPNNPTGTLWDIVFLEKLVQKNPNTLFLIDEAYHEFSDRTAVPIAHKYPNIIVSRTFSKAFALAGVRFGYVITQPQNITTLNKVRNAKSVNSFAQVAASAALEDIEFTKQYIASVKKQTVIVKTELLKMQYEVLGEPNGNYLLVNFGRNSKQISQFLEKNHIFIRSLSHIFNDEHIYRITIGADKEMKLFLNILKKIQLDLNT